MIEVLDIISSDEAETSLTEDQIEFKKGFIGSSNSAKLVGTSRYGGLHSLYWDLVDPQRWESSSVQRAGTAHERGILMYYAAETGHSLIKPASIRVGHLVDSVDAIVVPEGMTEIPDAYVPDIVVEAKMVDGSRWMHWGKPGTDQIDPTNLAQVIHHIGCWGAKRCDVVALIGGRHSIFHVEANPEMFQLICDQADALIKDHVIPGIPPPPDPVQQSIDILRRMEPKDPDLVDADDDMDHELRVYADLLKQRDALKHKIMEAEVSIQARIGDFSGVSIESKSMCSFKWEERKSVDRNGVIDHLLGLLGKEAPDRIEVLREFTTTKGSRAFRASKSLRSLTLDNEKKQQLLG